MQHITAEDLETLGRRAGQAWADGQYRDIGSAVVGTVKQAGLTVEQVKRTVEFANTHAFLGEFRKNGSARYVDFGPGVLADPVVVIQQLNGVKVASFDPGADDDYQGPPVRRVRDDADEILKQAFAPRQAAEEPDPMSALYQLHDKLAGAHQHLTSDLSSLEVAYEESTWQLAHHVKVACVKGLPLGDVIRAFGAVTEDPTYVKCAFEAMSPRLIKEHFGAPAQLAESIQKTASLGDVDPQHPLVEEFGLYCDVLTKLAETRYLRDVVGNELAELKVAIKQAAAGDPPTGLIRKFLNVGQHAAPYAEKAVGWASHTLGGPEKLDPSKWNAMSEAAQAAHKATPSATTKMLAEGAGHAARYAPHALAAGAAMHGYNTLNRSPGVHRALSYIPGTDDYEYANNPYGGGQY